MKKTVYQMIQEDWIKVLPEYEYDEEKEEEKLTGWSVFSEKYGGYWHDGNTLKEAVTACYNAKGN